MNVHRTKPERFPSLCLEHMFLSGFTIVPSLTISENELWYMWCLTVLFATKLVLPVRPTLRHISTPDHAPTLLWTLLERFSPLTWWRKQLQNISNFHQLDRIPDQEADMFTSVFIVHMPYSNILRQKTIGHRTWRMNGKHSLILSLLTMILQSYPLSKPTC